LIQQQRLQDSIGETKEEIDVLLEFSKNEIKKYSSYSVNEFKKVTESLDTITGTFGIINKCKYIYF